MEVEVFAETNEEIVQMKCDGYEHAVSRREIVENVEHFNTYC